MHGITLFYAKYEAIGIHNIVSMDTKTWMTGKLGIWATVT